MLEDSEESGTGHKDILNNRYCDAKGSSDHFAGVYLEDLAILEKLFEVNIQVFRLSENTRDDSDDADAADDENKGDHDSITEDSIIMAELIRRSVTRHGETMNVNLYRSHYSFITDLDMYCKAYRCSKCNKPTWPTG